MKFYYVATEYLDALKLIDNRVMNYQGTNYRHKKFVFGAVMEIENIQYYISVTSVKFEFLEDDYNLKEEYKNILYPIFTSVKIELGGGKIKHDIIISSCLRVDYMFPVPRTKLTQVIIDKLPTDRSTLVQKQYKYCNLHREKITEFARNIYNKVIEKSDNMHVKCCNFKDLELEHNKHTATTKKVRL